MSSWFDREQRSAVLPTGQSPRVAGGCGRTCRAPVAPVAIRCPGYRQCMVGLLGVLLGAMIVGVSNYVVQRHRMGREDAARRRAEERELRRAARIVLEELHLLERLLSGSLSRAAVGLPNR